jgi:AraC-like DNA-binding protein
MPVSSYRSTDPQISHHYLDILTASLTALGIPVAGLLAKLSIPEELSKSAQIPLRLLLNAWHCAMDLTENPLLSLSSEANAHPTDFGALGSLVMHSNTLGQALETANKLEAMINPNFLSKVFILNGECINQVECLTLHDHQLLRPMIEMDMAFTIGMAKFLTRKTIAQEHLWRVEFKHQPAASLEDYERLLESKVLFGCEHNRLVFDPALLAIETYNPNPDVYNMLAKGMANNEAFNLGLNTSRRIKGFILSRIEKELPTQEEAAKHLNISISTLKKQLSAENSGFQKILNDTRMEKAESLLQDNSLSISEIAERLGFAYVSNFTRAFKRTHGCTPLEYKERNTNAE